jgi:hypothetical protein
MGAHQIELQFANLITGYAHISQFAHTRRDRVGNPVFSHQRVHHGTRPIDGLPGIGEEEDSTALDCHVSYCFESQIVAVNVQSVQDRFRFG